MRFYLRNFRLTKRLPERINFVSRGSTVFVALLLMCAVEKSQLVFPQTVFLVALALSSANFCVRHSASLFKQSALNFRWFPEIQNIYYQGNKRKQVPSHQNEEKLKSFFNCAATLMTEQLQNLCLHSIEDFANLIAQPPVSKLMQPIAGLHVPK